MLDLNIAEASDRYESYQRDFSGSAVIQRSVWIICFVILYLSERYVYSQSDVV